MINNYIDLGLQDPFEKMYLSGPSNTIDALNNLDNLFDSPKNRLKEFKQTVDDTQQWYQIIYNKKNNGTSNINGTLKELLDREGVHYRITSSYRPGARTKQGKVSNHSKQDGAYDIAPAKGYTWSDLKNEIYGNKTIVDWMNKNGWGIIDETVASTKAKTGATGDHWHFGPDTLARQQWRQNLARYGQAGMKFDDYLATPISNDTVTDNGYQNSLEWKIDNMNNIIDENSDEYKSKYLQFLENLEKSFDDDFNKDTIEDLYINPLETIKQPTRQNKTNNTHKGKIPDLIHKMIPDKQKADILTNIAYKESGFDINAKNPVSTASGLFQQTNANKKQYGYGPTAEAQIQAASRFYDDNLRKINSLVSQYGNRGKSLQQLMYAYWFNPKGAETFIKTGKDVVTDKQGTTMTNVLNRLT